MTKNLTFYIGLALIIFFCYSSSLFAETNYSDYEHILVDNLPEPSEVTQGYIYDYDNKYYVTEYINSSSNIKVGDNLFNKTLTLSFPDNLYEEYTENCDIFHLGSTSESVTTIAKFRFRLNNSGTYYFVDYFDSSGHLYRFNIGDSAPVTNLTTFLVKNNNLICSIEGHCVVKYIDETCPAYKYIKVESESSYSWKEISYYDWYVPVVENK